MRMGGDSDNETQMGCVAQDDDADGYVFLTTKRNRSQNLDFCTFAHLGWL